MTKSLLVPIVVSAMLALVGAGCSGVSSTSVPNAVVQTDSERSAQPKDVRRQEAPSYSASDVKTHDSAKDCWMTFGGEVYDFTSYVSKHPGGKIVTKGCGKEASGLFKAYHSFAPDKHVAPYRIGSLN